MTICNRVYLLVATISFAWHGMTHAAVIERGYLNIINDAGNPSDGLRYLDMFFSDGLTTAAAVANAQLSYPDARLATSSEFNDLFSAAGILYDGTLATTGAFTASFTPGQSTFANYDGGVLSDVLGYTCDGCVTYRDSATVVWSSPDRLPVGARSRVSVVLTPTEALIDPARISAHTTSVGWLLVSEPLIPLTNPEPTTLTLMLLAASGLAVSTRRRRPRRSIIL
jgi:hypothetical protein